MTMTLEEHKEALAQTRYQHLALKDPWAKYPMVMHLNEVEMWGKPLLEKQENYRKLCKKFGIQQGLGGPDAKIGKRPPGSYITVPYHLQVRGVTVKEYEKQRLRDNQKTKYNVRESHVYSGIGGERLNEEERRQEAREAETLRILGDVLS